MPASSTRVAGVGAAARRRCRSDPISVASADGVRFIDVAPAARPAGHVARRVPGGDRRRAPRSPTTALSCIQQHAERFTRGATSFRRRHTARRLLRVSEAARRACTRGCRRCTTAACSAGCFREFQAITCRVVRDFYHKYTVDEHTLLTIRNLERLATPVRRPSASGSRRSSRSSKRPSCSCCRCCCTTSASGATRITPPKACAWRARCSSGWRCRPRRARPVEFLIAQAPADVARSRSGATPRIPEIVRQFAALVGVEERLKMLCLMTLADVEAVSLRDAHAVEGGAALAALRRHLQSPDAGLRRRADRPDQPARHRAAREPAVGDLPESEISRFLEGFPAATCSSSSARRSIGTSGWRATSRRTRCTSGSSGKGPLGADRRHARQAVPLLEHLGRAVVVRHGHPARPRDDQPERPGARRLPVHRRRALPRAERGRARASSIGARRRGVADAST